MGLVRTIEHSRDVYRGQQRGHRRASFRRSPVAVRVDVEDALECVDEDLPDDIPAPTTTALSASGLPLDHAPGHEGHDGVPPELKESVVLDDLA